MLLSTQQDRHIYGASILISRHHDAFLYHRCFSHLNKRFGYIGAFCIQHGEGRNKQIQAHGMCITQKQITVSGRRLFNPTTIMTLMGGEKAHQLAHIHNEDETKSSACSRRNGFPRYPTSALNASWSTRGFISIKTMSVSRACGSLLATPAYDSSSSISYLLLKQGAT